MNLNKMRTLAVLTCLLLAGCGGDGNDIVFSPDRSLAQGVYEGTITYTGFNNNSSSISFSQQSIVLENGEFFIIYGNTYNNAFLVDGFQHGTGQISGSTFYSYDLTDHFFNDNSISSVSGGRLTADFVAGNYFNGQSSQTDSTADFTGTAPATSVYNYNSAADLTAVTGTWSMVDLIGNQLTMDIGSSGSVTGTYTSGCSFTGTLTPRSSGKNVFNTAISFGPTPCPQPNQTLTGIARNYAPASQSQALVFAGLTSDSSLGMTLFGIR